MSTDADDDILVTAQHADVGVPSRSARKRLRRTSELPHAPTRTGKRGVAPRDRDRRDADVPTCGEDVYLHGNLYEDRKKLGRLGAKFDASRKQWYVPAGTAFDAFKGYMPASAPTVPASSRASATPASSTPSTPSAPPAPSASQSAHRATPFP